MPPLTPFVAPDPTLDHEPDPAGSQTAIRLAVIPSTVLKLPPTYSFPSSSASARMAVYVGKPEPDPSVDQVCDGMSHAAILLAAESPAVVNSPAT